MKQILLLTTLLITVLFTFNGCGYDIDQKVALADGSDTPLLSNGKPILIITQIWDREPSGNTIPKSWYDGADSSTLDSIACLRLAEAKKWIHYQKTFNNYQAKCK